MNQIQHFTVLMAGMSSFLFAFAPGCARPLPNATRSPFSFDIADRTSSSLFSLPGDSKPRRSQGAGSRGCSHADLAEVVLLIPSQEVAGQTRSGYPSFFLYLSKAMPVPIQFSLSRPGELDSLYKIQLNADRAGFVKIELPKDLPELLPDNIYLWSVMLECNPQRPSANPYYFSWIERVPVTPSLEAELAATQTIQERARIYGRVGAWYDTLALLMQVRAENLDDGQIQADLNRLLAEAGLETITR